MQTLQLSLELRRWRAAGKIARLWWRDDGAAGSATTLHRLLLERLLQVSQATSTPVTLAVAPVGDMTELAARLDGVPLVNVAQYGVDQENRRTGPAAGEIAGEALPRLDAHLDLMRWGAGGARCRGRGHLLNAFARELRRRRTVGLWEAPIGLLSHHRVHDTAAWTFLGDFLRWSKDRPEVTWVAAPTLIGEAAGEDHARVRPTPLRHPADPSLEKAG